MSATTESPRVQGRPHPRWAALSRKTATFSRRLSHGLYQRLHPCARTTPVFIVGCQRSGTTMALRTFELSRHARAFHTGDAGAYEHGMLLPRDSVDRLLAESRAAVTVFKPMNQTQRVGSFLEDYPNLRVIWLVRDYRDVVNSCVRKWTNMREVLGGVIESPQTAGWHGEGISPRQREVLRCHYRPQMSLESAYALFWWLRNSLYFEQQLEADGRVKLVAYEELVARPQSGFAEVYDFCGCPYETSVTREIFTSSVGRHAQPEIEPDIAGLCDELAEQLQAHN